MQVVDELVNPAYFNSIEICMDGGEKNRLIWNVCIEKWTKNLFRDIFFEFLTLGLFHAMIHLFEYICNVRIVVSCG